MAARDSTKLALEAYYARLAAEQERSLRPRRKNGKPELEVVRACMVWLRSNKFSVQVVESRAVYSQSAGRYLSGQTKHGTSDIMGVCPNGIGAFIEVKAPGRLGTLRPGQRAFLLEKISAGAFAVVVDSVAMLETIYGEWEHRWRMEPELAKNLLRKQLPSPITGKLRPMSR